MNRKSNPRELKMKEELENFAVVIVKQHDAIQALTRENELVKADKTELLRRLEEANKLIGRLESSKINIENDMQHLLDFKDRAISMLEGYFQLV